MRQNLSKYLVQVKAGESLVVIERGREVARLTPSGSPDSPIARLVTERGATMPSGDLLTRVRGSAIAPATVPPSLEVLDALREERL